MKVEVNNLLRVKGAALDLNPGEITAVTGWNSQGKSSLATAVAALLCQTANPFNAAKSQGKIYVHEGADTGGAELKDADGEPLVRWQAATGDLSSFAPEGMNSLPETVGLVDFTVQMAPKARTELWERLFLPPPAELMARLREQLSKHLDKRTLGDVMNMIEAADSVDEGIDAVTKTYAARAADAKRAWTKVTGIAYGVRKAADWRPEKWSAELDGVTEDDAREMLQEAQGAVDDAHIQHAIEAADVEKARSAEAELQKARKQLEDLELKTRVPLEEIETARQAWAKAREEHGKAQGRKSNWSRARPKSQDPLECPECGTKLIVQMDGQSLTPEKLVLFDEEAAKQAEADWQAQNDAYQAEVDDALSVVEGKQAELQELEEGVKDLIDARRDVTIEVRSLERQSRVSDGEIVTEEMVQALNDAKAALERVRERVGMVKARAEAKMFHQNNVQYSLIAEITGPKGVRATTMEDSMGNLDAVLDRVAALSGWPRVRVAKDYTVSVDDHTFLQVCGNSALRKAQFSLQIAIAWRMDALVVVLDRADELDLASRKSLFDLLRRITDMDGAPGFLVCGTGMDLATLNPEGANFAMMDGELAPLDAG